MAVHRQLHGTRVTRALLLLLVLVADLSGGALAARADSAVAADHLERAARHFHRGELEAAVIELKNVLQADPGNLSARILLGRVHLRQGLAASAEKELSIALNLGGDRDEIIGDLGNALLLQRKYADLLALTASDELLVEVPVDVLILRGRAQFELGALDDAGQTFTRIRERDPDNLAALIGLAEVRRLGGAFAASAALLERAREIDPGAAEIPYQQGELELARRRLERARGHFERALELAPDHARARLALAGVAYELGDTETALEQATRVQQANPRDPIAAFVRAQAAARLGDIEQAKAALEQAQRSVTTLPDDALARDPARLQIAGVVHYLARDYARARDFLARFIKLRPHHHGMRRLLGLLELEAGDAAEAASTLRPLLNVYPNDVDLLSALGDAYLRLGRHVEAMSVFERAVEAGADESGPIGMPFALSRLRSGQTDNAVEQLERAVDLGTYSKRSALLLAMVQLRRGDTEGALRTASTLTSSEPDNPAAHNLVGAVHLRAGRYEAARAAFDKALELAAAYRPAAHNLARMDMAAGDLDAAQARYAALLERDQRDPQALMGMAEIARAEGDMETAIGWLERASGRGEGHIAPQLALVALHLANDDPAQAVEVARRLEDRFPENGEVVHALARAQAAKGDVAAARTSYRRAVRYSGYDGDALLAIARGQVASGDYDGARYTLTKAADGSLAREALAARTRLELMLDEPEAAAATVATLAERFPDAPVLTVLRAALRERVGDIAGAIAVLRAGPTAAAVVVELQRMLRESGDRAAGIAVLEDYLDAQPGDVTAGRALALAYLEAQRLDDARVLHEKLLATLPDDAALTANLARIYQLQARDGARELAARAVELAPTWGVTLDTLGWILVTEGEVEAGLRRLRAALARDANPLTRYHLAVALQQLGRGDEARGELDRILRDSPGIGWIGEVRALRDALD